MASESSQDVFDAVRAGDTGKLQALLSANPNLANARNERGHSPVLIAQYHHKTEAVAVLLAAGPELDIFDAASVGDTRRVAACLDRDPKLLTQTSSDGFTPLELAAFFGQSGVVGLLLERGGDPAKAAGLAAMKGHLDVLKLLKDRGKP